MLSTIIPVFNNLKELQITLPALYAAVEELINSAGCEVEIILSDDGSHDGTREWIRFKYPEINYYWHANLGRGPNRNFGAVQAKGTWLLFLDSDVELEAQSLKYLFTPLLNGQGDIVLGNIRLFMGDRHSPLTHYLSQKWEKLMRRFSEALDPWDSYSGLFVLSKKLFDQMQGFSSRYAQYGGEDTDFFVRACQSGARLRFAREAVGWHHQPLDLKSNLRRTYWGNYSFAQMPFPVPDRELVEHAIDYPKSKKRYFFDFMTRHKLWSKVQFFNLLLRHFPPRNRLAFYFYHFLFLEYAEKGYLAGKETIK
jgi:glycosyltransferase involved in cell wall biosynthesis